MSNPLSISDAKFATAVRKIFLRPDSLVTEGRIDEVLREIPHKHEYKLVRRARAFAILAHESINQRRKYSDDKYIVHPAEVVDLVKGIRHTTAMLCAAWLHDVLEDVKKFVSRQHIAALFGKVVAVLVDELTDVSTPEDGNRERRKTLDRQHSAAASAEAQSVKVCDLISNGRDIVSRNAKFATTYLVEKEALLRVLTKADPVALALAWVELTAAKELLVAA